MSFVARGGRNSQSSETVWPYRQGSGISFAAKTAIFPAKPLVIDNRKAHSGKDRREGAGMAVMATYLERICKIGFPGDMLCVQPLLGGVGMDSRGCAVC
jgi:hypothetical protein